MTKRCKILLLMMFSIVIFVALSALSKSDNVPTQLPKIASVSAASEQRRAAIESMGRITDLSFAPELDVEYYSMRYPDVEKDHLAHWKLFGRREGRAGSEGHFIFDQYAQQLLNLNHSFLEVGPFYRPHVSGKNVYYADILDTEALRARAKALVGVDVVPHIHFHVPDGNLDAIPHVFAGVYSAHNVEHQLDLVGHLNQVESLLLNGGYFFLRIPDKRFCFDRFIPASTMGDVLEAHFNKVAGGVHSLKSVIDGTALVSQNIPVQYWSEGDPIHVPPPDSNRVRLALERWNDNKEKYIDVHKWQFTCDTFAEIVTVLEDLHFTKFHVERVYSTLRNELEFTVILQKR